MGLNPYEWFMVLFFTAGLISVVRSGIKGSSEVLVVLLSIFIILGTIINAN